MAAVGITNITGNASDLITIGQTGKLYQVFLWLQLPFGVTILSVNAITLIVLYQTYVHQEVLRVLFTSMALSDVTVGMIYTINCFVRLNPTLLTVVTCGFRFIALYTVVFVSMGNVALLALDRCIVISFPFRYAIFVTFRRSLILSVLLWITSIILAFFSFRRALHDFSVCIYLKLADHIEVFLLPLSFFVTVLAILLVCYTIIVYHVRRQIRKIAHATTAPTLHRIDVANISASVDGRRVDQKQPLQGVDVTATRPKSGLRYLKTVTSILGLFLSCYTPLMAHFGYVLVHPMALQSQSTLIILNGTFFLLVINSIVNPILYTWKTRELQVKFLKLFCPCSDRCQARINRLQQTSG